MTGEPLREPTVGRRYTDTSNLSGMRIDGSAWNVLLETCIGATAVPFDGACPDGMVSA